MNTKLIYGLFLSIMLNGPLIAGVLDQPCDMPKDTRYKQEMEETPNHDADEAYLCPLNLRLCEKKFANKIDEKNSYSVIASDSETDDMTEMIKQNLSSTLNKPLKKKAKKEHTCSSCNLLFRIKSKYMLHMKDIHNDDRPFKCTICGHATASLSNLTTHERIHTDEKLFKCDHPDCTYAANRLDGLKEHKKSSHTGEKPYTCDQCDKVFARKSNLDRHEETHTAKKPCKCDYEACNFSAWQLYMLTRHKKEIHIGEKPCEKNYTCNYDGCGHRVATSRGLNIHKSKMHGSHS